ncbi:MULTISPECIES: hypothetical protein [Virgibacillus]|uniref:Uncharacterized protein n=1 Tax=Virgibacillus salarius TaxID=447199 RepID=A0A941DV72_9BACI|nr:MULTISPECIES: hypothetical protein [Virgibacillus]MBR7796326.1 hypothetical protein [Virgibacillus salarius]NAZ09035.1 hypothetical protein [Agaribacter marinus]
MTLIGLLGTVHTQELREKFKFSFELLEELILEFRPDIICGEVKSEDWKNYTKNEKQYTGYLGPDEYKKSILPLCKERNILFHPIDWFDSSIARLDHFDNYTKGEQKDLEEQLFIMYDKILKKSKECKIPFNGHQIDALVKEKHNWLHEINPEYQNLTWIARNQMMIINIKQVININPQKRILCTIGFEHNYFFFEQLSKLKNVKINYPLR